MIRVLSSGGMRAFLAIVAMMLFANSAVCADADRKRPDEESLRGYMAGDYDLIGRKPDLLRIHFDFDGKEYDATYRWQSDPDNYPRFTGYVYFPGTKSPGLEALFPVHR